MRGFELLDRLLQIFYRKLKRMRVMLCLTDFLRKALAQRAIRSARFAMRPRESGGFGLQGIKEPEQFAPMPLFGSIGTTVSRCILASGTFDHD